MNTLSYKGYEGTAEIDMERSVCRGKILFIGDLITYEADSPKGLPAAFEEAVDDYIATCADLGIEPKKPFKGQFNVRVRPELHQQAAIFAVRNGISLNEVVASSLEAFVNGGLDINHNVNVTVDIQEDSMRTVPISAATEKTTWLQGVSHAQH